MARGVRRGWEIRGVVGAITMLALLAGPPEHAFAANAGDAQRVVNEAQQTFVSFLQDPKGEWLRQNFDKVKAVMIYPHVVKAGLVVGGSGGRGVLLLKDPKTGMWSQPAFYTIGGASLGLEAGGEVAQVMILAMNQRGLDSLVGTSTKLGAGASLAVGPTKPNTKVSADLVSYSRAKGLYAGLDVNGSIVKASDDLNAAYYGRKVKTPVIVMPSTKVHNKGAAQLRQTLQQAEKKA